VGWGGWVWRWRSNPVIGDAPTVGQNKQALFLRMIFLVLIEKNVRRLFEEDSIRSFWKVKRFVRDKKLSEARWQRLPQLMKLIAAWSFKAAKCVSETRCC
jgi:hypothetical protein